MMYIEFSSLIHWPPLPSTFWTRNVTNLSSVATVIELGLANDWPLRKTDNIYVSTNLQSIHNSSCVLFHMVGSYKLSMRKKYCRLFFFDEITNVFLMQSAVWVGEQQWQIEKYPLLITTTASWQPKTRKINSKIRVYRRCRILTNRQNYKAFFKKKI